MPVSVSNTAYGIITDAMHDAGLLGEGNDPNSEQLANNMRRLCDIINFAQTQGIKLFLHQEIEVDLVAGTSAYTLNNVAGVYPVKHLRVLDGYIRDSSSNRRPLNSISWEEWARLPQGSQGAVTGYFVDKQATSLNIKFWNTPDTTEAGNTAVLVVHTQAANPFNLESDVSFPQEWRIYLRWALADDICTGQPQAIMDRCRQRAETYREMLEGWDVEDTATSFAADSAYVARSFR